MYHDCQWSSGDLNTYKTEPDEELAADAARILANTLAQSLERVGILPAHAANWDILLVIEAGGTAADSE